MKKTLKITLALLATIGLTVAADAGTFKFDQFINGYSPLTGLPGNVGKSVALLITNGLTASGTTITNGQSNVVYYIQGAPYGYTYGTNGQITLVTNRLINPAAWDLSGGTAFWSQWMSYYPYTNSAGTNQLPPAIVDVPIRSDLNLDPAQVVFSVTFTQDNVASSNSITFKLSKIVDELYPSTTADGQFSLAFTPVGVYNSTTAIPTNAYTITTNLPTWFTQGARAIRLQSIVTATNGGGGASIGSTNIYINSCGIGQYVP